MVTYSGVKCDSPGDFKSVVHVVMNLRVWKSIWIASNDVRRQQKRDETVVMKESSGYCERSIYFVRYSLQVK